MGAEKIHEGHRKEQTVCSLFLHSEGIEPVLRFLCIFFFFKSQSITCFVGWGAIFAS